MRITITDKESRLLIGAIEKITFNRSIGLSKEELMMLDRLSDRILDENSRETTKAQTAAAKKATDTRVQRAKKKIESAINILRMEGRSITIYSVSKEAGVSYNTAIKYKDLIDANC